MKRARRRRALDAGAAPFRPQSRAASLKQPTGGFHATLIDGFPPSIEGGLIEACATAPSAFAPHRFPPSIEGGLIAASSRRPSRAARLATFRPQSRAASLKPPESGRNPATPWLFPPSIEGGLIEARCHASGLHQYASFPPSIEGGLIEARHRSPPSLRGATLSALNRGRPH